MLELGGLHAERAALEDCRRRGEDPSGATMYVTLEPCAHQGRQPPCTEALLEAGIGRVVIASEDPEREGRGAGAGDAARRWRRGRVRRRGRGERRATAEPAVPQARPHRTAAGHPEAGDVARRPDLDRIGRQSLDLRRAEPRAGPPLARRIRRDRGRDRHRPCRRPPAHRPPARTPVSLFASSSTPKPASPSTPSSSPPSTSPRSSPSSPRTPIRPALLPCVTPAPRSSSPTAIPRATESAPPSRMLGRRGITSLFLEGGRTLASAFTTSGNLDESRIFIAPVLLSNPPRLLAASDPEGEAENEHLARRTPPPDRSERHAALRASPPVPRSAAPP